MRGLLLAGWATSLIPSALAGCHGPQTTTMHPVVFAVEKPYHVDIYCPEDTVIVVADDLAITVTDAPTNVVTDVTKTEWTSTMIKG